jgi:DNA-binding NtrC family response regulator
VRATGGNRAAAAELLGLSRQNLNARLKRHGLQKRDAPDL